MKATTPQPAPPPPGLFCPECMAVGMVKTSWVESPSGRTVLAQCSGCGHVLRHQGRRGAEPEMRPAPGNASWAQRKAPPTGWQWIGWVRQEGVWLPVALADDLGKCWDVLLHYPGSGDYLCTPTRPGNERAT